MVSMDMFFTCLMGSDSLTLNETASNDVITFNQGKTGDIPTKWKNLGVMTMYKGARLKGV